MIFWNIQLPVSTGRRGHIGVMSVHEMSHREISLRWCKDCKKYILWFMRYDFVLNIKLWFSVIRYLMTSCMRRDNVVFLYTLCSTCTHAKFQVRAQFATCVFLKTIYRAGEECVHKRKTRPKCLLYYKRPSSLLSVHWVEQFMTS